jgi:hypothetical protein
MNATEARWLLGVLARAMPAAKPSAPVAVQRPTVLTPAAAPDELADGRPVESPIMARRPLLR